MNLLLEVAEPLSILLDADLAAGVAFGEDRPRVRDRLAVRAGHSLHGRLLKAVIAFNRQLREGLSSDDIETLRRVLSRLQGNVA
jgi:hypothetical protein